MSWTGPPVLPGSRGGAGGAAAAVAMSLAGAGTRRLVIGHVGDSRVYRIAPGGLVRNDDLSGVAPQL